MPVINISGTPINFPDTAQSPDWSQGIIQFAEAVAEALATVVGPYDVSPQIYTMVSNANTDVSLPALTFSTSNVRGAFIEFTVFRSTTGSGGMTLAEAGELEVVYNPNGPTDNKWELSDEHTGQTQVIFSITDTGQVQFSSAFITGANHTGFIGYTAKALQQG